MPTAVPDWVLERFLLGELPPERQAALAARATHDQALQARLQALQASNQAILEALPPRVVAAQVLAPAPRPRRGRRWTWLAGGVAVAAGALLTLGPEPAGPVVREPAAEQGRWDDVRIKGFLPGLAIYRQSGDGPERLEPGALVRALDVVQLAVQPAGRPYGAVLSLDGRGAVTLHFPASADEAGALPETGPVPLDRAYQLDDAPRYERFLLITSDAPVDLAGLLEAARNHAASDNAMGGPLPLPDTLEQTSVLLRKAP